MLNSQEPPIDLSDLADLGEAAILKSIIEHYLKDIPAHLEMMQKAVAEGDAKTLQQQAHFFRGSSLNFKANVFVDVCQRIETQAQANALQEMPLLMTEFIQALHRVQEALETENKKCA